jgi:hypothetical protein
MDPSLNYVALGLLPLLIRLATTDDH